MHLESTDIGLCIAISKAHPVHFTRMTSGTFTPDESERLLGLCWSRRFMQTVEAARPLSNQSAPACSFCHSVSHYAMLLPVFVPPGDVKLLGLCVALTAGQFYSNLNTSGYGCGNSDMLVVVMTVR